MLTFVQHNLIDVTVKMAALEQDAFLNKKIYLRKCVHRNILK